MNMMATTACEDLFPFGDQGFGNEHSSDYGSSATSGIQGRAAATARMRRSALTFDALKPRELQGPAGTDPTLSYGYDNLSR